MFFPRLSVLLTCVSILIAELDSAVQAARQFREAHQREIVASFMELLAIPNVAVDPVNLRRNAEAIAQMLQRRGVRTQLLEHAGAPPVVYGELLQSGATRTVLFYAHYDGSPVNATEWSTPPFKPVLRSGPIERDGQVIPLPEAGATFDPEWRIYARSAGDDKAPVIALMTALDALKAAGHDDWMTHAHWSGGSPANRKLSSFLAASNIPPGRSFYTGQSVSPVFPING
ncbi:MAG: hypothetical protein WKF37_05545 [Bryobacteraceae bacterium]